jgi:uroporphyrinogen-III synthase
MDQLRQRGAIPVSLPTIRFAPPTHADRFDEALGRLDEMDWIVFTSVQGVEATWDRLVRLDRTYPGPRTKTAAIGPATRQALASRGIRADFQPSEFVSASLAQELPIASGDHVLLLRAQEASVDLPRILQRRGVQIEDVAAYRTVADEDTRRGAVGRLSEPVDWILFTSASTVEQFVALMGPGVVERLRIEANVACIGPVTAEAARRHGFRVAAEAKTHSQEGLLGALEEEVARHA